MYFIVQMKDSGESIDLTYNCDFAHCRSARDFNQFLINIFAVGVQYLIKPRKARFFNKRTINEKILLPSSYYNIHMFYLDWLF